MPQPHAAPGIYARAFLEGRLSEQKLRNYRRELGKGGGLSSYPHPRSMPDFWQIPNASMGLSTPAAIYQARFAKYLENRGLKASRGGKIWCFIGDGEADEPEVLGTDGYGRSESRQDLRDFFEVSSPCIVRAAICALFRAGFIAREDLDQQLSAINPDTAHPHSGDPAI